MDSCDRMRLRRSSIATGIRKSLKSIRNKRPGRADRRYVIEGFTDEGTLIYTKGRIAREAGEEIYYLLISSKRSTYGEADDAD